MTIRGHKRYKILLLLLLILTIAMIIKPETAYNSALRGLELWWQVIAPSLLPFFLISELMLELNVSRYLTYAMSPLMRPLFSLPGCAALAVVLGFCSGFPSGASITASLRKKNQISRAEGERMICFTNNAGPLYITVAVAGGLLHCPQAAIILAAVHYGSNLLLGIILGRLAKHKTAVRKMDLVEQSSATTTTLNLGSILKAAVSRAAANIISIGCLMVFFAVISGNIAALPLPDTPWLQAFIGGFWEMSLGINSLADSTLNLAQIIPLVAAILGFGGISVQMQVLAMVGDTDIRVFPYLICRVIQAVFSYFAATLLCAVISLPTAVFIPQIAETDFLLISLKLCLLSLALLMGISALILAIRQLRLRLHKD